MKFDLLERWPNFLRVHVYQLTTFGTFLGVIAGGVLTSGDRVAGLLL